MSVDLALSCNSCQIEPSVWKAKNFSGLSSRRRTLKSLSPKLIKTSLYLRLLAKSFFDTTHQILLRLAVEAEHFLHIGVDYICRRQYIEDLSVGNNSLRVFIIWELCRRLDNRHDCAILLTEFLIAESYRRVNICARVAILDSLALGYSSKTSIPRWERSLNILLSIVSNRIDIITDTRKGSFLICVTRK